MPSLRTGRLRLRLRDEQEPARGPPPLLSTPGRRRAGGRSDAGDRSGPTGRGIPLFWPRAEAEPGPENSMNRIVIILLALGATPVLDLAGLRDAHAGSDGQKQPARELLAKGKELIGKGSYRAALGVLKRGYRHDPEAIFHLHFAECHRLLGENADALLEYRAYLAAVPGAPERAEVEQRIAALDGGAKPAPPAPPPAPPAPPVADAAAPAPDAAAPEDAVWRLAKEGRKTFQDGKEEEGLTGIRAAIGLAEQLKLPPDDLATLRSLLGNLLLRADQIDAALVELRAVVVLAPKDAGGFADLGRALSDADDFSAAAATFQRALDLGLSGEDGAEVRGALAKARDQRLHELLDFEFSLSFGFDSNVLQGNTVETIGGVNQRRPTGKSRTAHEWTGATNAAELSEPGFPISVGLGIEGRPAGGKRAELWLGYGFAQSIYPNAGQDSYNFQEHRVPIRLDLFLARWLNLTLRVEGTLNFTGLADFLPYQGGVTGGLDTTAIESKLLRTRLTYSHVYAANIDRSQSNFDVNSDTVKLTQELRIAWFRARLGYQFASYRSGDIVTDVCRTATITILGQTRTADLVAGTYQAPTSYQGHNGSLALRFSIPWELTLSASGGAEYRIYNGTNDSNVPTNFIDLKKPCGEPITGTTTVKTAVARRDTRISAGLALHKDLPRGVGLELAYGLLYNLSNIENTLDNRNFHKHGVLLAADYSF
ncbi:MAG: tetratricopeptide repeat protein [Myxococcales bacterium]|nr:tetratricopeptide repeat protein [Myxococcales bacterium]